LRSRPYGVAYRARRRRPWLTAFADANRDKLRHVVKTYDDFISPFIRQPEAFILWERLDHDLVTVVHLWQATAYPVAFLMNMATVWGVDLPDE